MSTWRNQLKFDIKSLHDWLWYKGMNLRNKKLNCVCLKCVNKLVIHADYLWSSLYIQVYIQGKIFYIIPTLFINILRIFLAQIIITLPKNNFLSYFFKSLCEIFAPDFYWETKAVLRIVVDIKYPFSTFYILFFCYLFRFLEWLLFGWCFFVVEFSL